MQALAMALMRRAYTAAMVVCDASRASCVVRRAGSTRAVNAGYQRRCCVRYRSGTAAADHAISRGRRGTYGYIRSEGISIFIESGRYLSMRPGHATTQAILCSRRALGMLGSARSRDLQATGHRCNCSDAARQIAERGAGCDAAAIFAVTCSSMRNCCG